MDDMHYVGDLALIDPSKNSLLFSLSMPPVRDAH